MRTPSVRQFHKLHIAAECRGETRGVVYAWALTPPHAADSPRLPSLLERLTSPLGTVLADAAYSSRRNASYVGDHGGEPFFPPKFHWTARSRGHPSWRRMVLRYRHHPKVFHESYRCPSERRGGLLIDQAAPRAVPPRPEPGDAQARSWVADGREEPRPPGRYAAHGGAP
jgi:hypothetical protein